MFDEGILSLLKSRKFWIACSGVIGSILAARGLPPDQVNAVVGAIVALSAVLVGSIAHESAAESLAPMPPEDPGEKKSDTKKM